MAHRLHWLSCVTPAAIWHVKKWGQRPVGQDTTVRPSPQGTWGGETIPIAFTARKLCSTLKSAAMLKLILEPWTLTVVWFCYQWSTGLTGSRRSQLKMEFAGGFLKFKRGRSPKSWGDPYKQLGWHGWVSAESKLEPNSNLHCRALYLGLDSIWCKICLQSSSGILAYKHTIHGNKFWPGRITETLKKPQYIITHNLAICFWAQLVPQNFL